MYTIANLRESGKMNKQNKNAAVALRDAIKVSGANFVHNKITKRAKRELKEFASTAEQLLVSAREIAPIITVPGMAAIPEVLKLAPQYAQVVKDASAELAKIHLAIPEIEKTTSAETYQLNCLELSQQYVGWIENYQNTALPLAAQITDYAMALEVKEDGK